MKTVEGPSDRGYKVALVATDPLRAALTAAFERCAVGNEESARIADALVEAELCEVPTHGLLRLPNYIHGFESGTFRAAASVAVRRTATGVVSIDGGGTLGYLPTWKAVEVAHSIAAEHGVAAVGVHHIGEFGRAAYYAEYGTRLGVVCIVCQNTVALLGAPGSRVATHGNNPLAFSAPGHDAPLFDAAFTPRSGGELWRRSLLGIPLPLDWGYVDADGNPTTDARAARQAVSPAVGGAKGFGLSVLVDLLAGVLTGAESSVDAGRGTPTVGAMVLAFDPAAFTGSEVIERKLHRAADAVRDGGGRWPGDRGRAARARQLERGHIEVPVPILEAAASACGGFDPDPLVR